MDKRIIKHCLAEALEYNEMELETFNEETPLMDIGMDSIRFIQFIVAVEDAFQIEISDSDLLMERFGTLHAVYQTLSNYLSSPRIKKVLVLDCDNVLWNGIAGEEPVTLDKEKENFQQLLLRLYENGVLLCLCSRNDKRFIDDIFEREDMLLKKSHIAAACINRKNKVDNLQELARTLNLSVDSFVFIDDSDYEVGLIESFLPNIICIKAYEGDWLTTIEALFSDVHSEGRNRTELYHEQKQREKAKRKFSNIEDYNSSLQTVVTCTHATKEQVPRLAELSARTNQFNLSNAHYTKEELFEKLNSLDHKIFSLSVSDIYGDMGIVGMAVLHRDEIECFILSCRVFDRGFEIALLDVVKKSAGVPLFGIYQPTEKNFRYHDFYRQNGVIIR